MSSPTAKQRAQWRVFLETALALIDILDAEMQAQRGITLGWYDVLVHLEDAPEGLGMTEIANRILFSKSGLTRVIDRMEAAGLVRRERPARGPARRKSPPHPHRARHAERSPRHPSRRHPRTLRLTPRPGQTRGARRNAPERSRARPPATPRPHQPLTRHARPPATATGRTGPSDSESKRGANRSRASVCATASRRAERTTSRRPARAAG